MSYFACFCLRHLAYRRALQGVCAPSHVLNAFRTRSSPRNEKKLSLLASNVDSTWLFRHQHEQCSANSRIPVYLQEVTLASMNGALNAMGLKVTANGPDPTVWMVSDGMRLLRRFTEGMVRVPYPYTSPTDRSLVVFHFTWFLRSRYELIGCGPSLSHPPLSTG
eukprot:5914884-Pyramimonas_sp.AAC.1